MSKFLKALEQAEKEKDRARSQAVPESQPEEPDSGPGGERSVRESSPEESDSAGDPGPSEASGFAPKGARDPGEAEAPYEETPEPPPGIEQHLVSLIDPFCNEAEQYRRLRTVIEDKAEGRPYVVGVSSPAAGDGKTITATNLAGALSQSADRRVLLVDADFRNPSIHVALDDRKRHRGLIDAVQDNLGLDDVVYPTFWPTLFMLPAGKPLMAPYEVLQSSRVPELIQQARERFDFVVVDTPPMVAVSDCRLIEKWVDGFLFVVAAHRTPRKLIEEALRVVEPEKVVGFVFNKADPSMGYSDGYAYRYYGVPRSRLRNPFSRFLSWMTG